MAPRKPTSKKRKPRLVSGTRVTPAAYQVFLNAVDVGVPVKVAADYAEISTERLTALLEKEEVQQALKKAKAHTMVHHMSVMHQGKTNWNSSAWMLERLYPQMFIRKQPDAYTRDQVLNLLGQFSQVILTEIDDREARQNIQRRFQDIAMNMRALALGESTVND